MAFTDVEMAILSQCAYYDYPDSVAKKPLYKFLDENKDKLTKSLGDGYSKALQSLMDKVKDQPYTIVQTRADNDGTGFAAFAVADPNNEVTVACRGTEFDELFSEETKAVFKLLKSRGITRIDPGNILIIQQILFEHGIFGDGLPDVIADLQLAFEMETAQQEQMRDFVDLLEEEGYDGYYFTGHSLGGNLAMYGAMTLDNPDEPKSVVTYNAPGFNQMFWEENAGTINSVQHKFKTYQNERDAISECFLVPGNAIILECKDEEAGGIEAHSLNQLVLSEDGTTFEKDPDGKKEATGWGRIFGGASLFGNTLSYTWYNIKNDVRTLFDSSIRVPISELQEYAQKMQEYADDSADVFDRIYNSLTRMRDHKEWQGLSLDAIVTATQNNRDTFDETLAELQALATFVKNFANAMEAKDEEIKRKIIAVN